VIAARFDLVPSSSNPSLVTFNENAVLSLPISKSVPVYTADNNNSASGRITGAVFDKDNNYESTENIRYTSLSEPTIIKTKSPSRDQEGFESIRFGPNRKRKWLGGSASKDLFPYYLILRSKAAFKQYILL
jgi:hypothetical protein